MKETTFGPREDRRTLLGYTEKLLAEWLKRFDERGPGPTAKEFAIALDHMEKHLREIRGIGSRS